MIASAHGHLFTSLFFFGFIALSLGLTWWSMRRARDATGFFVAGRRLMGWQNGLAISGDYMSAASFLGIAGLVSLFGYDGLLYSFGFIVGWVVIVLLVAEPLRNSGKYTLSDVMAFRLRARPVRAAAAVSSVTIGLFYLLAQLVGAGAIASLLLPIQPDTAIILVGILMVVYVLFGGMVATTYVQIVKAVLVFGATIFLTVLLMSRFGFGAAALVGRDTIIAANKAGNSAAPLLALQLGGGPGTLGGEILVAFISAVTFATILAVVAGLIMAAATNVAHDVYTHVIKAAASSEKTEVKVAKLATIAVGVAAIALALVTKSLNVAFLVGLAFAVAASANLPVILYSLYWKRFNTTGAVAALIAGVASAVGLVLVGPAVIGPKGLILTDMQPLISLINPGIISIPIGFLAGWLGTVLTARDLTSEERFGTLQVRALTGFGSEQSAKSH